MKAILHDVAARCTLLPNVHFLYEGEDESAFMNSPNTLMVDVDVQGEVKRVTPTGGRVEVTSFYMQTENGEPTLHIQGLFPAENALKEAENNTTSYVSSAVETNSKHNPSLQDLPQSTEDLLEEFRVRNEFIRSLITGAQQEGLFDSDAIFSNNISYNATDKQNFYQAAISSNGPSLPDLQQQGHRQLRTSQQDIPPATAPAYAGFTSIPSPILAPVVSPFHGLLVPPAPLDGNDKDANSPDRRKGMPPTMISPYKGLPRHPSPVPVLQTSGGISKYTLNKPPFFDDTLDFTSIPTPVHMIPFMPGALLTSPHDNNGSSIPSPPHEIKQKVNRILHEALQIRSSIEGLESNNSNLSQQC